MILYSATVKDGKLVIPHRERFVKELQAYEGVQLTICIDKKKKNRSTKQLRYYWGVCVPIVLKGLIDMGFEPHDLDEDVVHDLLKSKFLKKTVVNPQGEFIELNSSTKRLSTVEFMDYVASIQQWGAEFLNVYIPDPNEF